MKKTLPLILAAILAGSASAQTVPAPAQTQPAPATPSVDPAKPAEPRPPTAAAPASPKEPIKRITSDTEKGMRLNFRGVPLEQVLNYFGEVAGYIIVPKVSDIRGRVDVWSDDPLTKDEAVSVLNNVLSRNGYAAFVSGRSLNIVNKDEMSRQTLPTTTGEVPEKIPANENMVTHILPIKFISAEQVIKNLEALLPTSAIVTANAGANALVITDTQVNIRRVAEIIKALDTPVASISAIRVFTLKYADAKALATIVKDLFATTDTRGGNAQQGGVNPMQQIFSRFGGGGGGRGGGGAGSAGGAGGSGGRVSTPKVVASADELSNSLIVSAPEDSMTMIEEVVKQVDVPVEDVTEIKVFRLKYASADDTATMLKNLFPDTSTQGGNRGNTGGGFRGGFFGGGIPGGGQTAGGAAGATAGQSQRALKQNKVVAVADNRTMSVIVTASPTIMEQITGMIMQLDSDPAKQQKVFVIPVENADPAQMQQILQSLFPTQSGRTAQSSGSQSSRGGFGTGTTTRNNGGQSNTGSRTGSSGFGGGGGSGFGSSGFGGGSSGGFGGGR